jgi:hypothetical protein
MTKLDEALRDAVRDLSDQGRPPADLGPTALAAGRRLQYRRAALTSVAAIAAVVAVAAPVLAVDSIRGNSVTTDRSPTSSPTPSTVPFPFPSENPSPRADLPPKLVTFDGAQLVAGSPMGFAAGTVPAFVYDATRKSYVKVPGFVEANRAGTLALVTRKTVSWAVGLLDLASNKTDWTALNGGAVTNESPLPPKAQWSPDGSKVLVSTGAGRYAVYDIAARTLGPWVTLDTRLGQVSWQPNGRELVATRYDRERTRLVREPVTSSASPGVSTRAGQAGERPKKLRLDVLDLAGRPVRSMPITSTVVGPAQWSPDGTKILTTTDVEQELVVLDTATGKTVARLPGAQEPVMLYSGNLWWLDNQQVMVPDWDVDRGQLVIKVYGLDGRLRRTHDLPWYGSGYFPVVRPPAR